MKDFVTLNRNTKLRILWLKKPKMILQVHTLNEKSKTWHAKSYTCNRKVLNNLQDYIVEMLAGLCD